MIIDMSPLFRKPILRSMMTDGPLNRDIRDIILGYSSASIITQPYYFATFDRLLFRCNLPSPLCIYFIILCHSLNTVGGADRKREETKGGTVWSAHKGGSNRFLDVLVDALWMDRETRWKLTFVKSKSLLGVVLEIIEQVVKYETIHGERWPLFDRFV